MDTDLKKGVISMRKGTLAVFLDINNETSKARVIGRDIKNNWQVYIVFYNGNKKEYVPVGQAEKKSLNFNLLNIQPKGYEVCGAAVGNKNTGEVYEGFFEKTEIKKEEPKKEKTEKSEPKEIKEESKKETEKEILKENPEVSEEKEESKEEIPENKNAIENNEENIQKTLNSYEPLPEHEAVYDEYIRNKKENKAEDTFKQVLKKFRKEMTELEKAGVFEKSETAEILSDRKNTAEKIDEIKNEIKEKYKNIIDFEQEENKEKNKNQVLKPIENKNIEYMFSNNEKLTPFKEGTYDWVRICKDELWFIPLKKDDILNPFVMLSDLKYKHLMLGKDKENKRLIFAVPEKFGKDDLKNASAYGFKDFWKSREENGEVFGYWIKDIY